MRRQQLVLHHVPQPEVHVKVRQHPGLRACVRVCACVPPTITIAPVDIMDFPSPFRELGALTFARCVCARVWCRYDAWFFIAYYFCCTDILVTIITSFIIDAYQVSKRVRVPVAVCRSLPALVRSVGVRACGFFCACAL